jgi:hypothetical protein
MAERENIFFFSLERAVRITGLNAIKRLAIMTRRDSGTGGGMLEFVCAFNVMLMDIEEWNIKCALGKGKHTHVRELFVDCHGAPSHFLVVHAENSSEER